MEVLGFRTAGKTGAERKDWPLRYTQDIAMKRKRHRKMWPVEELLGTLKDNHDTRLPRLEAKLSRHHGLRLLKKRSSHRRFTPIQSSSFAFPH
jgi:hypothetical protein